MSRVTRKIARRKKSYVYVPWTPYDTAKGRPRTLNGPDWPKKTRNPVGANGELEVWNGVVLQ